MLANYKPFVERMIFRYEGNYGWDAGDPGGPTKYGITCYDLAEHLHEKMDSMAAWAPRVKAMSMSVADDIYANKYATACRFAELNSGCDCVVFDFGVNSGPSRAVKFAQRIVHVGIDGVLGPVTLKAINTFTPSVFINDLCDARLAFLRSLGTWPRFGRGWASRVADLREYSLALASKGTQVAELQPEDKEHQIPQAFAKAEA